MVIWLDWLQQEVERITEDQLQRVIMEKCQSGEHVLGILPIGLRKLYYLVWMLEKEEKERKELILSGNERSDRKLLESNYCMNKAYTLQEFFWVSVTELFPDLKGRYNCQLREGWKVVWLEGTNRQRMQLYEAFFSVTQSSANPSLVGGYCEYPARKLH